MPRAYIPLKGYRRSLPEPGADSGRVRVKVCPNREVCPGRFCPSLPELGSLPGQTFSIMKTNRFNLIIILSIIIIGMNRAKIPRPEL